MTRAQLLSRNLFFHWRGNFAVLLGAAVGAAVLAGALLVGDSLRGSLRARAERQLGWVSHALVGGRFFRQEIAAGLPAREVSPAILLQGAVRSAGDAARQASKVTVLGVADEHWVAEPALTGDEPAAVLSAPLAETLHVREGDRISVSVAKASAIPRSSVLGRRSTEDATSRIDLTVSRVLPPNDPANEFSLSPSPGTPLNLWMPLRLLQSKRGLDQPGRVNALFVGGAESAALRSALRQALTPDDWGLTVEVRGKKADRYVSLESRQLLLDPPAAEAAKLAAEALNLRVAPTFVYLVNRITPGAAATPLASATGALAGAVSRLGEIPYSVVAALPTTMHPPLGPFQPEPSTPLADDEIVLVDWFKPTLLGAQPGKPVTLTYFKPEIEGRVEEATATFRLRGFIPLTGPADDPGLTPEFPGITDKLSIGDWDPPFPYDSSRVGRRDEQFWEEHRATPKAYVTLAAGQKLWGSRFGDLTSIRLAPRQGSMDGAAERFRTELGKHLDPDKGGFTFEPVRQRLLEAGQGSTDFGLLFLAFSFFLVAAALMLVGLLFRLNLDRRASEVGLLLAAGFPQRAVRRLLLLEGLILSAAGAALGLLLAPAYADLMLWLLATLWPAGGVGSFLRLHVTPTSLAVGLVAAVAMSQLAVVWAVRVLRKVPPSALLNGEATPPADPAARRSGSRWAVWVAAAGLLLAAGLGLMAPALPPGEAQAGTFFGSGSMLLAAALALLWAWMKRPRPAPVGGHGAAALARLGARNATRNPTRSLLTAGLLASAAFLLVAVESFRREPERDFLSRTGGSGGFPLLAEADVPLPYDPNSPDGRADLLDNLQRAYQQEARQRKSGPPVAGRVKEAEAELEKIKLFPFRLKAGDDASCLNLYQATRPRLLGVPDALVERGGFSFADTEARTPEQKQNPWLLLLRTKSDGAVPVFVEQNTAVWMLKKGLGDTLDVPGEDGRPVTLRIAGLLQDSVFQSELLLPDWAFRKYYPRHEGFAYFLADPGDVGTDRAATLLTDAARPYGLAVTPTRDRVAAYLAVQNTYLTTFQLLGGFGLLLGVLGLAVVLLRSVWERRGEFALLRAVGYRRRALNELVLAENALLLVLGLGAGLAAALAAVAPHLAAGQDVPFARLAAMLGLVLVVGLAVAALATAATLRAPLIPALRKE